MHESAFNCHLQHCCVLLSVRSGLILNTFIGPAPPKAQIGPAQPKPMPNARAACTNMVAPNDGCLSEERVWCCAGVKSNYALQGLCTYWGPAGTTRACPVSGTPMRYCCPFTQDPGEFEGTRVRRAAI